LTVGIAGYVYSVVMQLLPVGPLLFGFLLLTPLVYGGTGIVIGGVSLALWSRCPLYALSGAVFTGVAVLSVAFGCPAVACPGSKQFHLFFEWTVLGPAVSASFDAGRCAYICPHTVELIPLIIGYLLVGKAVASSES
jgi:hypothetical protein